MQGSFDPPGKKRKTKKVVNKPAASEKQEDMTSSPNQEDEQIVNTQEQDQAVNSSGRPGNVSKEDFLD